MRSSLSRFGSAVTAVGAAVTALGAVLLRLPIGDDATVALVGKLRVLLETSRDVKVSPEIQ